MEDMEKVAVVILNWNGCEMLRSFLPSVVAHSEADGAGVLRTGRRSVGKPDEQGIAGPDGKLARMRHPDRPPFANGLDVGGGDIVVHHPSSPSPPPS